MQDAKPIHRRTYRRNGLNHLAVEMAWGLIGCDLGFLAILPFTDSATAGIDWHKARCKDTNFVLWAWEMAEMTARHIIPSCGR